MWEIIGTALLSGSAGFVAGAYWIVRYKPGPGIGLDEEDHREQWDELRDYCSQDVMLTRALRDAPQPGEPRTWNTAVGAEHIGKTVRTTHLIRGGTTGCCGRRAISLPWGDLVTADPLLVDCAGPDPVLADGEPPL